MDPNQFEVVTRERLTCPNFELDQALKQTLKEVRNQPTNNIEIPETNAQLKQNSLRRELKDTILWDEDGQKILGGDNKTIWRWWKG